MRHCTRCTTTRTQPRSRCARSKRLALCFSTPSRWSSRASSVRVASAGCRTRSSSARHGSRARARSSTASPCDVPQRKYDRDADSVRVRQVHIEDSVDRIRDSGLSARDQPCASILSRDLHTSRLKLPQDRATLATLLPLLTAIVAPPSHARAIVSPPTIKYLVRPLRSCPVANVSEAAVDRRLTSSRTSSLGTRRTRSSFGPSPTCPSRLPW